MKRVVVDSATLAKLLDLCQSVDLCDESGRAIGRFRPAILDDPAMQPQISEEEIERRMKLGGGRPLAEILVDLEKRA